MRTKTAKWFETKVRYDKTQEDGRQKKVTETYVVDALSFGEAEARITHEMTPYITGDFEVKAISPAPYIEIWFMGAGEKIFENEVNKSLKAMRKGNDNDEPIDMDENNANTHYYRVRLAFITIGGKNGKEKRNVVTYLVEALSAEGAIKNAQQVLGHSMTEYVVLSSVETTIIDVFEHNLGELKKDVNQSKSKK